MEPKTVRRDDGTIPARHIESPEPSNALLAGTEVLTLDGTLPVDHLLPGDRVITRDSGTAVLAGIRCRHARVRLVAIRGGTLGQSRPETDVLVPATQEILVRDWRARTLFGASRALVPAERLADGEFIRLIGTRDVVLLALQFDAPHILYADGLELASATQVTVAA